MNARHHVVFGALLAAGLGLAGGAAVANDKKPAAKKPAAKDHKPAAKAGAKVASLGLPKGIGRWRKNAEIRNLAKTIALEEAKVQRGFPSNDSTLARAQKVAAQSPQLLDDQSVDTLARVLFVLEVEGKGAGAGFLAKVRGLKHERFGKMVDIGDDVIQQTAFYQEIYAIPCRGNLKRTSATWPPHYDCDEKADAPTHEPRGVITLNKGAPKVIDPPSEAESKEKEAKGSQKLADERRARLKERDSFAIPHEKLGAMPTQFCVGASCVGTYAQAAQAVYGGRQSDKLPVFCAPQKVGDKWETSKVHCSADWLNTLGGWQPWNPQTGAPNKAPKEEDIPPFACVGSPHLFQKHMILPAGGETGSGFRCRNRIFRVLVTKPAKDIADQRANIANMCEELRGQVWGEKYPNINETYDSWCKKQPDLVKKGFCRKPGAGGSLVSKAPDLPFMLLSREEVLFFYGHEELYCRADRKGLLHFLDPEHKDGWAKTMTCAVARGLLESGPFEEGVQTCAVAPYIGAEESYPGHADGDLKARLHCWKFSRPTCNEISDPATQDQKDSIHNSNVFDVLDALKESRRTHNRQAWTLYDMKDSEKLKDFEDRVSYSDGAKDEGTFGVKEFCRFVGRLDRVQCGYTKKTVAQYYELHRDEPAEGCARGVCARGSFKRGYYCGLFSTKELFEGQPYWMCGIDVGAMGHRLLDGARAICVGGARSEDFQSAKGDKGSLQCYERRFRWGESEATEGLLRGFSWAKAVKAAAKIRPHREPWLAGGQEAHDWLAKNNSADNRKHIHHSFEVAYKEMDKQSEKDEKELIRWASKHGHTLGHRTALRLGFIAAKKGELDAWDDFKKLKFDEKPKHEYHPLGDCTKGMKKDQCLTYRFEGEDKEKARDKNKAKALNDLLHEVIKGERAPDGKWYQDFRLEATEDGQLRMDPKSLEIVVRLHHLFEVLEGARKILLRHAQKYAEYAMKVAKTKKPLSRLEIHERARRAAIPNRYKGNVFCVTDPDSHARPERKQLICASSPLLVAGMVEHELHQRLAKHPKDKKITDKLRQKVRAKVRFDWCYGGTENRHMFGLDPSKALSERALSSPYFMDIPPSVSRAPKKKVGKPAPKNAPKKAAPKKKKASRELDELSRVALAEMGDPPQHASASLTVDTSDDALVASILSAPAKPAAKKPAGAKKAGGAKKPAAKEKEVDDHVVFTTKQQTTSTANWMRCTKFRFSDEVFEEADPKRERKAVATKGKDGKGDDSSNKILQKVGGLLGSLVNFVLPGFADAIERVKDLAHAAGELYDKWVGKLVDKAQKKWAEVQSAIEKAQDVVEKAKDKLASAEANMKSKAKEELDAAKSALKALEKAVGPTLDGSGDIVSPLMEELITTITTRIIATVEPGARNLLSRGFKFVRSIIDPIANAIISTVASVPFVGGALAAAAQVAYSFGMDALENAAFDALKGVVERILTKFIRPAVTPVFKTVMSKVLELAFAACNSQFKFACPKGGFKLAALPQRDQWINRALACPGREIFDRSIYRNAAIARRHIEAVGEEMRRDVAVYSRDIADRYLASYGMDLNGWMAAVSQGAVPQVVAQAARIEKELTKKVEEMKRERAQD